LFEREKSNQRKDLKFENLFCVHLVTTLIKRLTWDSDHGRFEPKNLQNYLNKYVFRYNRRK
jgi:hypothetical protein